jgi:hypothetical protein
MKVLNAFVASVGLALTACSFMNPPHELSDLGKTVRIVERRIEVINCRFVTTVQGHAASVFEGSATMPDIEADTRNQAGFHGGNVIIAKPSHELIRNADFRGIIYDVCSCPESGPPLISTPGPASETPARATPETPVSR